MSGGVDSSVAASLLVEAGYDVAGVFMRLGAAACQDPTDARRVAEMLGVDLFVLDLAGEFEPIIRDFVAEYARGRTPNPCIHCNARVKFGCLLDRADSLGARYVATGHHARIVNFDGRAAIARGLAREKDQSYALFAIGADALGRILLPVGEIDDKRHIREIARRLGLNVHDKPDSQEICFVPDDYTVLLSARAPEALRGGVIVGAAGEVLGRHDGYARFTIGQRRGLVIAAGEPLYVTRIDPDTATVTVGPRGQTLGTRLTASGANWHRQVSGALPATVQVRYNHTGAPARVSVTGPETFDVAFDEPVHAITPGQAAVVYEGNRLLGGGWID